MGNIITNTSQRVLGLSVNAIVAKTKKEESKRKYARIAPVTRGKWLLYNSFNKLR